MNIITPKIAVDLANLPPFVTVTVVDGEPVSYCKRHALAVLKQKVVGNPVLRPLEDVLKNRLAPAFQAIFKNRVSVTEIAPTNERACQLCDLIKSVE